MNPEKWILPRSGEYSVRNLLEITIPNGNSNEKCDTLRRMSNVVISVSLRQEILIDSGNCGQSITMIPE